MPAELEQMELVGGKMSVAAFIRSRPLDSEPYLIKAAYDCLQRKLPLNEAELLIATRRIRYLQNRAA